MIILEMNLIFFFQIFFQVWKALEEKNVRLTSRHFETFLSGLNENGILFDPDKYWKLINEKNITLTPRLYSLILNQYGIQWNRLNFKEKFNFYFKDSVEMEILNVQKIFSEFFKSVKLKSMKISFQH